MEERRTGALVAVLGGNVSETQMNSLERLLERADSLLIGGDLAIPFLKARGGKVGSSPWTAEQVQWASDMLEKARACGVKILLPLDVLAANEALPGIKPSLEGAMALFEDKIMMDIGPRTVQLYQNAILAAGTVFWGGDMGKCELPAFANGTNAIHQAISRSEAKTIQLSC